MDIENWEVPTDDEMTEAEAAEYCEAWDAMCAAEQAAAEGRN